MKPPTKFELMRAGRARAAARRPPVRRDGIGGILDDMYLKHAGKYVPVRVSAPTPVPTMEVDGVKYREAPETIGCLGCAFNGPRCTAELRDLGQASFGGWCGTREVIYIKAA